MSKQISYDKKNNLKIIAYFWALYKIDPNLQWSKAQIANPLEQEKLFVFNFVENCMLFIFYQR